MQKSNKDKEHEHNSVIKDHTVSSYSEGIASLYAAYELEKIKTGINNHFLKITKHDI